MLAKCFISPNNIYVDIAQIVLFDTIYLAYVWHSLAKNGWKFTNGHRIMVKITAILLTFNAVIMVTVLILMQYVVPFMENLDAMGKSNFMDTLEQVRGFSNYFAYQTIQLMFLQWLFKLQIIEIQLDDSADKIYKVIKNL